MIVFFLSRIALYKYVMLLCYVIQHFFYNFKSCYSSYSIFLLKGNKGLY